VQQILGTFTKLQKTTVSFVSVRRSAWHNWAPTGWIFMELRWCEKILYRWTGCRFDIWL